MPELIFIYILKRTGWLFDTGHISCIITLDDEFKVSVAKKMNRVEDVYEYLNPYVYFFRSVILIIHILLLTRYWLEFGASCYFLFILIFGK